MDLFVLSSGSCGNCAFVRSGDTRIIVDAGIPVRTIKHLLASIGESIDDLDGLLITHDHRDHMKSAEIVARRHAVPVFVTEKTLAGGSHLFPRPIDPKRTVAFRSGDRFSIGALDIESVPTPHDAADPVGFVVDDGVRRLGVFTDLGHGFDGFGERLGSLDAVMLETNYDDDMLEFGPYPAYLKRRIRGTHGHLSNLDAASLLRDSRSERLRTVIASHLSEENNHPERVLDTFRRTLDEAHLSALKLVVTRRGMPTTKLVL